MTFDTFMRVTVRGTDQPHKLEQPSATLGPATNLRPVADACETQVMMATPGKLMRDYAAKCRKSAEEWMELADRLPGSLRTFALSRAADNLEIAQRNEIKTHELRRTE